MSRVRRQELGMPWERTLAASVRALARAPDATPTASKQMGRSIDVKKAWKEKMPRPSTDNRHQHHLNHNELTYSYSSIMCVFWGSAPPRGCRGEVGRGGGLWETPGPLFGPSAGAKTAPLQLAPGLRRGGAPQPGAAADAGLPSATPIGTSSKHLVARGYLRPQGGDRLARTCGKEKAGQVRARQRWE